MKSVTQHSQILGFILWVATSVAAWMLCPVNLIPAVHTWVEALWVLGQYAGLGLLMGAVIGFGQNAVLQMQGFQPHRWIGTTVAAYGIGFPVAFGAYLLNANLPWMLIQGENILPLTQLGSITLLTYPTPVILSGGVIGLIQWLALRPTLIYFSKRIAALYILGTWLSISFGLLLGTGLSVAVLPDSLTGYPLNPIGLALIRSIIGLVAGILSALIAFTVLQHGNTRQNTTSVTAQNR